MLDQQLNTYKNKTKIPVTYQVFNVSLINNLNCIVLTGIVKPVSISPIQQKVNAN